MPYSFLRHNDAWQKIATSKKDANGKRSTLGGSSGQAGQRCNEDRGWYGLRGACKRGKKGYLIGKAKHYNKEQHVERNRLIKESKTALAEKIKSRRSGLRAANAGGDAVDPRITVARPELTKTGDPERIPERLRKHLSVHQRESTALALEAMDKTGGFLLADGTGVGKTRTQLAVAAAYAEQGKKVLIVSKAEVLKPDWKSNKVSGSFAFDGQVMGAEPELTNGSKPLTKGKISITTYDQLSKVKGMVDDDTIVIYDEAHSLKNSDSIRTKHGTEMADKAGKVLFATATPADKISQLGYLKRAGLFGDASEKETLKWMTAEDKAKPEEVYRRMTGLFDELTDKGLMIKRELSLKGVKVGFNKVELPDSAHATMKQITERYKGDPLGGAQNLMDQRRQLEPYKVPAAIDLTEKALKDGRQMIIFASRVNESSVEGLDGKTIVKSAGTVELLRAELKRRGIADEDIVEIHGNSKTGAPEGMEAFQSGRAKVVISTIESGGTGINLDDSSGIAPRSMVIMTPPFSAVENVQAVGRVWRLKTQSAPEVTYLSTDTQVDQWNESLITSKMKSLQATILGESGMLVKNGGASDDVEPAPRPPKKDRTDRADWRRLSIADRLALAKLNLDAWQKIATSKAAPGSRKNGLPGKRSTLSAQSGQPCNEQRGWYGYIGSCLRGAPGLAKASRTGSLTDAQRKAKLALLKESRDGLVQKLRSAKGLQTKTSIASKRSVAPGLTKEQRIERHSRFQSALNNKAEARAWVKAQKVDIERSERVQKAEERRSIAEPFVARAKVKAAGGDPVTVPIPQGNPYSAQSRARRERLVEANKALGGRPQLPQAKAQPSAPIPDATSPSRSPGHHYTKTKKQLEKDLLDRGLTLNTGSTGSGRRRMSQHEMAAKLEQSDRAQALRQMNNAPLGPRPKATIHRGLSMDSGSVTAKVTKYA